MHRGFIQNDRFPPKIDAELRGAAEKVFGNLACLSDQIALIGMQLLVFSRIVADNDELYRVGSLYFIQTMIIYDGRFMRIRRCFIGFGCCLLQKVQLRRVSLLSRFLYAG